MYITRSMIREIKGIISHMLQPKNCKLSNIDEVIPDGTIVVVAGPTELSTLGGSEWPLGEAETPIGFTTANSWLLLDLPPQ